MKRHSWVGQHGSEAIGAVVSLMLLLAGCAPQISTPAPVVNGVQPPPRQMIVQGGQTLSGIARTYHVPVRALADANRLSPPYRILVGQTLIIPGSSEEESYPPAVAMAEPTNPTAPPPMAAPSSAAPAPVVAQPLPLAPASAPTSPPAVPGTAGATPPAPTAAAAPPHAGATSPSTVRQAQAPSTEHAPTTPSSAKAAPGALASAEPSVPRASGTFLWPVHGHVLQTFGPGPDGTHNDGMNIAAPRGAAVAAVSGGVVAYAGNELRGYGNLILIKHPNGFISAYAHCDQILVKTGQKVARGQVIARVGSTGNVSGPQLHFELRQGKKPVDPREYLLPLPAAATGEARSG
jgi:murein DD-endopeptidase MepM/ murein hydrolase activator NlpD